MGRPKKQAPKTVRCKACRVVLTPADKPYHSKQTGMEGVYHWTCFIDACKNRVPVSIGAFETPAPAAGSSGGSTEEREVESAPVSVED